MGSSPPGPAPLPRWSGKKVALPIDTKEDWPCTFVQLCEDLQHVPISDVGHISIMIDGTIGRSACGCLSHLEVHQLLQFGSKVVYPEGLNGHLKPTWVPFPKPPIWEFKSSGEPTTLHINLPSIAHRDSPSIAPQHSLMLISSPHSAMECPSDLATGPSLTVEVEELLSSAISYKSEHPFICTFPRRPTHATLGTAVANRGNLIWFRGDIFHLLKTTAPLPKRIITSGYSWYHGSFQPLLLSPTSYPGGEQ